MSLALLTLLAVTLLTAIGYAVAMFVKDKPWYGVIGLALVTGPAPVLALLHVALVQT